MGLVDTAAAASSGLFIAGSSDDGTSSDSPCCQLLAEAVSAALVQRRMWACFRLLEPAFEVPLEEEPALEEQQAAAQLAAATHMVQQSTFGAAITQEASGTAPTSTLAVAIGEHRQQAAQQVLAGSMLDAAGSLSLQPEQICTAPQLEPSTGGNSAAWGGNTAARAAAVPGGIGTSMHGNAGGKVDSSGRFTAAGLCQQRKAGAAVAGSRAASLAEEPASADTASISNGTGKPAAGGD
jgi:hypothetical protein